jgi:hypothetical protein
MMNAPKNPILIGIIAGLVTAILMAAAGYASVFTVLLVIAAMTSIFVAGLGYGLISCLVAIAVAALATGVLGKSALDAVAMGLVLIPAAVMSYLANLARPASELGGPESALAWYPISDILFAGALVAAIGAVVPLFLHGDIDLILASLADSILAMMQEIEPQATPALSRDQLVSFFQIALPLIQGAQLMIGLYAGFYYTIRILSVSGRSARPREDVRTSLRMNRLSIAFFVGGVILMFAGDRLEMIGASFAGTFGGGFLLAGFAIIHNALRDKSWRLPGLILVYLLSVFLLPMFGLLIIIAGGLANPRRAIAVTPDKPQTDNNR